MWWNFTVLYERYSTYQVVIFMFCFVIVLNFFELQFSEFFSNSHSWIKKDWIEKKVTARDGQQTLEDTTDLLLLPVLWIYISDKSFFFFFFW